MKIFFVFIVFILFFIPVCISQQPVAGKIIDENNKPLPGVSITINNSIASAITDSTGNYSLLVDSSITRLSFSHIAFQPATILIKDIPPVIRLYSVVMLLPETIVHSFERNTTIQNIPAAVSILNKTQIERYGSGSFVPAINTVPGVKMDERSPGSYRLSIRGNILRSTFGVRNVKVYWNGIPFTDANGTTYFNELALNNIDRIEILKGPSGSLYGAGTGGVILLSNAFKTVKDKNITAQVSGGSYGMRSASAGFNEANAKNNISVSFSHQQAHGYRQQSNMHRDAGNFTGIFSLSKKDKLHANIFYSDLYYQTPGGLTAAELNKDPKQARPAAGSFQSAIAQQAAIYLKTIYAGFANEYKLNEYWQNTLAVYASNTDFKNPTIRNYEKNTQQGIGLRTVTQYKKGGFTATCGAEYQYGITKSSTYGNRLGATDSLQFKDNINSRQLDIFLQGDFSINETFIINAGLSYNNFHFGFIRTTETPLNKVSADFKPAIVPRISLLKKIRKNFSAYASVSKGFSPPSIDEVRGGNDTFNKDLHAETGINYEVGFKGDLIKNKCWIEASIYYFSLDNTIVSRRDSSGGDYYTNAGKTSQHGLEAAANYLLIDNQHHFLRRLQLWGSYTGINAKFKNYQQGIVKYDGNKLTGAVPNLFSAGADVNTSIHLYINLTYSYTDKIPLNDANTFFAKPYNLFFAKLGYKLSFHKNILADIFVSYEKSFNQPYSLGNDLNAAVNRFYNPSSPQNFYAGIRMQFIL